MAGLAADCKTDTLEAARASPEPSLLAPESLADFVDFVLEALLPGVLPEVLPEALPVLRRALVSIWGASSSVSQLH